MITGERKPFSEIKRMVEGNKKILVAGCGTCVTVHSAGGEKEVGLLASQIRLEVGLEKVKVTEKTVQRQCEWEFVDELKDDVEDADIVISMACGAGVQALAEKYPHKRVIPALNTTFLGITEEPGVWSERCVACGDCVLEITGGICPVARCAKSLLNGPCGGSQDGKCEVSSDIPCAWQLIYDRLKSMGDIESMEKIYSPKDWSKDRDGGPRRIVREDLKV